jgi:hypothetical protein
MTAEGMVIHPSIKELQSRGLPKLQVITIITTLARGRIIRDEMVDGEPRIIVDGKLGISIVSKWKPDREAEALDLVESSLITQVHKERMMPMHLPDRHKRAARKAAAALFGLRVFKRLRLYGSCHQDTVVSAQRGSEEKLFLTGEDAEIWSCQVGSERANIDVMMLSQARKKLYPGRNNSWVLKLAQENSVLARHEIVQLFSRVVAGQRALDRLKTLEERGLGAKHLGRIWDGMYDEMKPPRTLERLVTERDSSGRVRS